MTPFTKIFGAAALALSTTTGAAFAQNETQRSHPCSNITTTTDVTQCLSTAIPIPDLITYVQIVGSEPELKEISAQMDAENEACGYITTHTEKWVQNQMIAQLYPYHRLKDMHEVRKSIKTYFENVHTCYSDSLKAYKETGITAHEEAISRIIQASKNAVEAITLEQ